MLVWIVKFEHLVASEKRRVGLLKNLHSAYELLIVVHGLKLSLFELFFLLLQSLDPVLVLVVQSLDFR